MRSLLRSTLLGLTTSTLVAFALPSSAAATVPECSGVAIAADAQCEQRIEIGCQSSCELDDVLMACAAELTASCKAQCDFDFDIQCSNDCGATCEQRCLTGDVVCHDECAEECSVNCVDTCAGAEDPRQCRASCEATCASECDQACGELTLDASCDEHCNRCCIGSCTAQANFDCQIGCQGDVFEACQFDTVDQCGASCGTSGTIYCDGQFVAGGDDVDPCMDALQQQEIDVTVDVALGERPSLPSGSLGLCRVGGAGSGSGSGAGWLGGLLVMGLIALRRRRR
ncbi:MAG: hypothetical protein AAGF11_18510 [Myxococcota bacterium]